MKTKFPETAVLDKAITTAYNKIGYEEFCAIIGQEPRNFDGKYNQYAIEKFELFKQTMQNLSILGSFWEKIIDWCIENPID